MTSGSEITFQVVDGSASVSRLTVNSWSLRTDDRLLLRNRVRALSGCQTQLMNRVGDSPVFSVHQTDVIYYGPNLVEYLKNEFNVGATPRHSWAIPVQVPFWSRFVESGNRAECI